MEPVQDKLHQPYRAQLIPDYDLVIEKMNALGAAAAFLSGAGPTIMTWWRWESPAAEVLEREISGLTWNWQAKCLKISDQGVIVEE